MAAAGQFRAQHPELERDDLFDEDQAVWHAVHAVLDTLKAERETRSAR